MQTNLAQARRSYYGDNTNNAAAQMDSGSLYYNANGSRTGERIDGRVKRKTMMGGASQGPISSRPNRSEMMEKEAEMQMEQARQKGEARAREQATNGARPDNGVNVTVGGASKPSGYWKDGRSAGSLVYVSGNPPATGTTSANAATPGQKALMAARRSRQAGLNLKASQDRQFSRFRIETERNPGKYAFESVVNRRGTQENNYNGMAKMREEARQRGELNPPSRSQD